MILFALAAISLLVIDSRYGALEFARRIVGTILYPVQIALIAPRDAGVAMTEYFGGVGRLRQENERLVRLEAANAGALQQGEHLAADRASTLPVEVRRNGVRAARRGAHEHAS